MLRGIYCGGSLRKQNGHWQGRRTLLVDPRVIIKTEYFDVAPKDFYRPNPNKYTTVDYQNGNHTKFYAETVTFPDADPILGGDPVLNSAGIIDPVTDSIGKNEAHFSMSNYDFIGPDPMNPNPSMQFYSQVGITLTTEPVFVGDDRGKYLCLPNTGEIPWLPPNPETYGRSYITVRSYSGGQYTDQKFAPYGAVIPNNNLVTMYYRLESDQFFIDHPEYLYPWQSGFEFGDRLDMVFDLSVYPDITAVIVNTFFSFSMQSAGGFGNVHEPIRLKIEYWGIP